MYASTTPNTMVWWQWENAFRRHLNNFVAPGLEAVTTAILENEDMQFQWLTVSCSEKKIVWLSC